MDNFEKHIRDAMNNPPEFSFKESMWDDMESRLDAGHHKKDRSAWWIPVLITLLMGSGISSTVLYHNQVDNQLQIKALTSKLKSKNSQAESNNLDNQNQIERHTIIEYDTIYRTVVIEEKEYAKPKRSTVYPNLAIHPIFTNSEFISKVKNKYADFKTSNSTPILNSDNISKQLALVRNQQMNNYRENKTLDYDIQSLVNKNLDFNPYLSLKALDFYSNWSLKLKSYPTFQHRRKFAKVIKKLNSYTFSLSADVGRHYLINMPRNEKRNIHSTLLAEFRYGQFSVLGGIGYLTQDFAYLVDKEHSSDVFPTQIANNEGDLLYEIYGEFSFLQVPFGLQYSLLPSHSLQPYIGIGGYFQKALSSDLEYEFYTVGIGNEYPINQNNVLAKQFVLSDLWTTIGAELELKTHWSVFGDVSAQINLNQNGFIYENRQFVKWKGGLKYHF